MIVIISPCTKIKDASIPILDNLKTIRTSDYLNEDLARQLIDTREIISRDPKSAFGNKSTLAFDLYIRKGKSYRLLFEKHYQQTKSLLLERDKLGWFFLSGLYGIINALEKSVTYQATFNKTIAYQNGIPYTTSLWKAVLPKICDYIFSTIHPEYLYIFGSRDYTGFIEQTEYWKSNNRIKLFKSVGSAGPTWISPILDDLVTSIIENKLNDFNMQYDRLTIQK